MRLLNYFDRIYVNNLPYRTDRRKETEKELRRVGASFDSGHVVIFPAIKPEFPEPFRKLGSKGNFLSVLQMLKQAQKDNLQRVLIMEDDIEFPKYYELCEDTLLEQLTHASWDVVQFGYFPFGHFPAEWSEVQTPEHPLFGSLQSYDGDLIGSHFYGINGASIGKLIAFLEELLANPTTHPLGGTMEHMMSIDGAITCFCRKHDDVTRLIPLPSFGGQRRSKSDVTPNWFDSVPVLNLLAALMRKWGITKLVRKNIIRA
jgi:glycosyl transferase family 25